MGIYPINSEKSVNADTESVIIQKSVSPNTYQYLVFCCVYDGAKNHFVDHPKIEEQWRQMTFQRSNDDTLGMMYVGAIKGY